MKNIILLVALVVQVSHSLTMITLSTAEIGGIHNCKRTITVHDKNALGLLLAAKLINYPLVNRDALLAQCESIHGFTSFLPNMILMSCNNFATYPQIAPHDNSKWHEYLTTLKNSIKLSDQEKIEQLSHQKKFDLHAEIIKIEQAGNAPIALQTIPVLARLCLRVMKESSDEKDIGCLYNITLQPRFVEYLIKPSGQRFYASNAEEPGDMQFLESIKRMRDLPKEKELIHKEQPRISNNLSSRL